MRLKYGIISLFLLSTVCAENVTVSFRSFTGGLNDTTPSIYLQPGESPDMQNMLIDELPGLLIKRNGASEWGRLPAGSTGTYIMGYKRADGLEYMLVKDSATLYMTQNGSEYTTLKGDLNPNSPLDCSVVYNDVWCVNGDTWTMKITTGNVTLLDGNPSGEAVPPIAEYIEFNNDTVWLAKSTGSRSGVFFSRVSNNEGFLVNPSSNTAWIFSNEIRISPDDGDILYGLKKYRGYVFPFKSKNIHIITGSDPSDYSTKLVVGNVGTISNDSIKEDNSGLLNFVGRDGIYVFDGVSAKRTSDKITNAFNSIFQPTENTLQKGWTSEDDFDNGTRFTQTTSSRTSGSLQLLETDGFDNFADNDFTSSPIWGIIKGTMTADSGQLKVGSTLSNSGSNANLISTIDGTQIATGTWTFDFVYPSSFTPVSGHIAEAYVFTQGNNADMYGVNFSNSSLGRTARLIRGTNVGRGGATDDCIGNATNLVSSFNVVKDSATHSVKVTRNANDSLEIFVDNTSKGSSGGVNLVFTSSMTVCMESNAASTVQDDFPIIDNLRVPISSGSYQSEIYDTGGSISSWGTFSMSQDVGNGALSYFIRNSTSPDMISSTYSAITNGAIVPGAVANRYVQWLASFTAVNPVVLTHPSISNVTINWVKAGSSQRLPAAKVWKNRYWLAVSTTGTNNNQLIYVRGKNSADTWMRYDGLNIRNMTIYDNKLFAVDSSTNRIVQLDVGDNDYGGGINAYWQTKDETFGSPLTRKALFEIGVDAIPTGNYTLNVDISTNAGVSFSTQTVNLDGQGRIVKRITTSGLNGYQYRFKIGNSAAGQPIKVLGIESDVVVGKTR